MLAHSKERLKAKTVVKAKKEPKKKEPKAKKVVTPKTGPKAKKKRLKIAVQLYGHLRTFEICAPALKKHVLDHYDCDVFIHTWDEIGYSMNETQGSKEKKVIPVDDEVLAKVEKLYKPKVLKVESQTKINENGIFDKDLSAHTWCFGAKYLSYSQYQSSLIRDRYQREKKLVYDFVVASRPDIILLDTLDIQSVKKYFLFYEQTSIHFVLSHEKVMSHTKYVYLPFGLDLIFLSTPECMSKITKTFLQFDYFFKSIKPLLPHGAYLPELCFMESIRQKNIIPRFVLLNHKIQRQSLKEQLKRSSLKKKVSVYLDYFWKLSLKCIFRLIFQYSPSYVIRHWHRYLQIIRRIENYINRTRK